MSRLYYIFSAQYFPHLGGVELYTSHMAKGLLAAGDRVLVVTPNPGSLPLYERIDGVPVLRLPSFPLMDGRFPVTKPNAAYLRLHRKLKNRRPDVVIVNTRFYTHSLYGILFGRLTGAQTLVIDHGSSHLSMHQPFLNVLGECFEHAITFFGKMFAPQYYSVSRASLQWLRHFHIEANGILSNAVDLPEISARLAAPKREFRAEYGIPEDDVVCVYTGRLLKEKGLLPLAEAFRLAGRTNEHLWLFLAGDGPLEDELRQNCPPRMVLTGRLDAPEIIDLLHSSDIFCLPSVSEGFSTSMMEAAACRNYVIVTESARPSELLLDDSYASLLPNDRAETIAEAILWAAAHETERKEAAERTYRQLISHFTWDRTIEKLRALTDEGAMR